MTAVPFDTLKFVEKLEDGGFTPQQAKAAAQAFAAATGEQLAVKSDIDSMKIELRADIKAAASEVKVDILRWLVLTQVALGGLLLAAMRFLPPGHP